MTHPGPQNGCPAPFRAAKVPAEKLRQAADDGTVLQIWQEVVDELDARPLPRLQNTDGEDLLLTVDRFDLAAGAIGEARARLLELQGAEEEESQTADQVVVVFSRPGNTRVSVLPTTLVARAVLEGKVLKVETNSVKRADRMRRLIEEQLGSLATYRIREHVDPVARLGDQGRVSGPDEPPPPEVLEALRQLQAEHYRRWVDESIPAPGGLTPREAVQRTGKPRRELELILAEIENGEARRPAAERLDLAALRRELGMG